MRGFFMFPTARFVGREVRALIVNDTGDKIDGAALDERLAVDVMLYHQGQPIARRDGFADLAHDAFASIDSTTFPELGRAPAESLCVARCALPAGARRRQNLTHWLYLENAANRHVIGYEQMPIRSADASFAPIILLSHATWVGPHRNSFIVFCNAVEGAGMQSHPLELALLDDTGATVCAESILVRHNDVHLLDAKAMLRRAGVEAEHDGFYTAIGRGGAGTFIVLCIVLDLRSGNIALEHTMSPHTFMKGDRVRLRREAMVRN